MTERLHFDFSLSCIGEGNGNPLQCSCLENPRDGGAWWAAVYGVAESDTTDATWQQRVIISVNFQKVKGCVCVCSASQSCLTLCDPVDCSPPGFSVHGILHTRILRWAVISSSRGSS